MEMIRKHCIIWPLLLSLSLLLSCSRDSDFDAGGSTAGGSGGATSPRQATQEVRRVLLMVSGGHNSLSSYLADDLQELSSSYIPHGTYRSADVMLVLSRLPKSSFATTSAPALYRMYTDAQGTVVRDTIKVWPEGRLFAGTVMKEALALAYERFPAKGYGMVFSSHASGWLPDGYYNDPSQFENTPQPTWGPRAVRAARREVFPPIGDYPAVKSLGQDKDDAGSVEMELADFVDAIPMHLDYLLIDACLSGCVEVAYALRGKADVVGFSQTEVLANGFDYRKLTSRLLAATPDPKAVCEDYFAIYKDLSGISRSATISLVDTRNMDGLAQVCKDLFARYRTQIDALEGTKVQGYFRYNRHFFYDLKDILVKAGITAQEQEQLDAALDACVLYKAATPYFMQNSQYGFAITNYCGLSMYLPSMGSSFLDNFYKANISWNTDTGLVYSTIQ